MQHLSAQEIVDILDRCPHPKAPGCGAEMQDLDGVPHVAIWVKGAENAKLRFPMASSAVALGADVSRMQDILHAQFRN